MIKRKIVLIRNENEYREALAEISSLWGSEPGTPDGSRLDTLGTLVNVYESEHYPVRPAPARRERIAGRLLALAQVSGEWVLQVERHYALHDGFDRMR